jgi:hypothetical protein
VIVYLLPTLFKLFIMFFTLAIIGGCLGFLKKLKGLSHPVETG